MASDRRWEDDERGRGVGDARAGLPAIEQLAKLATTPDWVAEDPESHLMPHLKPAFAAAGMTIAGALVEPSGRLLLKVKASRRGPRELRQAIWTVLGQVAEHSSHIRERKEGEMVVFEMVTGIPPGDGRFATHGHTLRIEVLPA